MRDLKAKGHDANAFKCVNGANKCTGFECSWHTCYRCARCDRAVCSEHHGSHSCGGSK